MTLFNRKSPKAIEAILSERTRQPCKAHPVMKNGAVIGFRVKIGYVWSETWHRLTIAAEHALRRWSKNSNAWKGAA